MSQSTQNPSDDEYYPVYRQGMIERHICKNGRLLEGIWMVEQKAGILAAVPDWDNVRRNSVEIEVSSGNSYNYQAYPLLVPYQFYDQPLQLFIAGGGDNPLLMGGLAMATLSLEEEMGVSQHLNSFEFAKLLLSFVEESEVKDHNGDPTGFLVRKRHFWRTSDQASIDELCGLLVGLLFFHRAAKRLGDNAAEARAAGLASRIGSFLQRNNYLLSSPFAPATGDPEAIRGSEAFIYQFPYGRVFKELTGGSFRMGNTFPSNWQPGLVEAGLFIRYVIDSSLRFDFSGYSPKDLFKDLLYHLPWAYNLSQRNFFNLTMLSYCVLMVIVPDVVETSVKREIAHEANDFFKKLCFDHGALDFIVPDGFHNALFGVIAKRCAEIEGETDSEWLNHIDEMIEFLNVPSDRWFRDLPLGLPKDTSPPRQFKVINSRDEFLWGEWYAWTKTGHINGPRYSFTNDPEWMFSGALSHLGPDMRYRVESIIEADLSTEYTPEPSQGFRLEASGIDFLFARILASFFGFLPNPTLPRGYDNLFSVLPVDGPVGDGYLANASSGQVHDLSQITTRCFISKIKDENIRWFQALDDAYSAHYDPCGWCLGITHVGQNSGAPGDPFLGNRSSLEVHDLSNEQPGCHLARMNPTNRIYYRTISDANSDGFDNCKYCIGTSSR